MAHEDYKEMLAAQALNALEAAEMRDLEAHLPGCAECRSQLLELEETAGKLAFVSLEGRHLEPSPQLRGRILEAIRAETWQVTQANPSGAGTRSNKEIEDGYQTRPSNVMTLRRPGRRSPAQTWSVIAAGLVLAALAASLFVFWKQNRDAREEVARLTEELARQRQAIEIMASSGTRMTELAGTKMMPGAHAILAYDKNGSAILMARGLPPAPVGKAYQLWFIAGGKPMPGKVFSTDASGAGTLKDQIPTQALNSAVFAITLEPENGVESPTGEMYLISAS